MATTSTNSTLTPSVGSGTRGMEDSSNLATMIATALLAVLFVGVVAAFLVYRYLKRTSGPVWIQSKLDSIRGRYSNMNDKHKNAQGNFIIGFGNPMCDGSVLSNDNTDKVTVLGYRRLDENQEEHGMKDHGHHYKLMFPRDRLVFGTVLGTGWFGKVYEADAYRIKPGWRRTKVVTKELQKDCDVRIKDLFLRETNVYRRVEHKNLVSILGQATEQEPYLVIMEHTPVGDLKKFLLEKRCDDGLERVPLSLRMSIDIASGLHCLHANCFYHSDLAARNCLVFTDHSVKIGDYGISRCIYEGDYYGRPDSTKKVPIRWLPPDDVIIQQDGSLDTKPPSSSGNVWSFGVTLWEIVEGGKQPYEHLSDEEVLQSVIQDKLYQLPEPQDKSHVADLLYELMLQCWVEPERRPRVEKLESTLMSLMSRQSVPQLTRSIKEETSLVESSGLHECKTVTQPVAIVRPLRYENGNDTSLDNELRHRDRASTDVEVTVIVSETPPPVTYIGDPSEELDKTSNEVGNSSMEIKPSSAEASLDIEVSHEYVVVPGEVIRRRGSILRNPDAPSKPRKAVHFPVNILDLRTVHKYERLESYEEENIEHEDEEQETYALNFDYPISSDETDGGRCKFPVEKDVDSLDALTSREPSSPVEKKLKKASRRKKLGHCEDEWVATLGADAAET